MKRRTLILCAAAALLASLAFATPSQAGSTLVTTDVTFSLVPSTVTITDFTVGYTPVPMPGMTTPVIVFGGGIGATVSSFSPSASTVTIDFSPASATLTPIEFYFYTTAAPSSIGSSGSFAASGASGTITTTGAVVTVVPSSVPEPASLALLGIGMTGLLAFRRFSRRNAVA